MSTSKESRDVLQARLEERTKSLFETIHLLQTQTTGFENRLKEGVGRIEDIADQVQIIKLRQEGPEGSIERLRNLERIVDHIEKDLTEMRRAAVQLGILDSKQGALEVRIATLERIPERAKWTTSNIRLVALFVGGLATFIAAVTGIYFFLKNLGR